MTDESARLYELNASLFSTTHLVENGEMGSLHYLHCCTVITWHISFFCLLFYPLRPPVTSRISALEDTILLPACLTWPAFGWFPDGELSVILFYMLSCFHTRIGAATSKSGRYGSVGCMPGHSKSDEGCSHVCTIPVRYALEAV